MDKKIVKNFGYDKEKDLSAVEQFGFVDLSEVFSTGTISGSLNVGNEDYNHIEDPESMLNKADDIFELYRQTDYVANYTPASNEVTTNVE